MLKDDYIIKDTENVLRYLSRLLFSDDLDHVQIDKEGEDLSQESLLYSDLKKMIHHPQAGKTRFIGSPRNVCQCG